MHVYTLFITEGHHALQRVREGAHKELRELHDQLDRAVSDAYGWPPSVLSDPVEITSRLLVLNAAIAAGEQEYTPFPALAPPPEPQSERLFLPD